MSSLFPHSVMSHILRQPLLITVVRPVRPARLQLYSVHAMVRDSVPRAVRGPTAWVVGQQRQRSPMGCGTPPP